MRADSNERQSSLHSPSSISFWCIFLVPVVILKFSKLEARFIFVFPKRSKFSRQISTFSNKIFFKFPFLKFRNLFEFHFSIPDIITESTIYFLLERAKPSIQSQLAASTEKCARTSLAMLGAKQRSIRAFGLTSAVVSDGEIDAFFSFYFLFGEGLVEAL